MAAPKRTNTGILILSTVLTDLDQLASTDDQGRTRNQLIEQACREYVKAERRRRHNLKVLGEFDAEGREQGTPTHPKSGDTTFSGQQGELPDTGEAHDTPTHPESGAA
jgi:predicted transcriptional regulator